MKTFKFYSILLLNALTNSNMLCKCNCHGVGHLPQCDYHTELYNRPVRRGADVVNSTPLAVPVITAARPNHKLIINTLYTAACVSLCYLPLSLQANHLTEILHFELLHVCARAHMCVWIQYDNSMRSEVQQAKGIYLENYCCSWKKRTNSLLCMFAYRVESINLLISNSDNV